MSNRHLARSVALQSLFECDFGGCDLTKLDEVVERNMEEFAPGMLELSFVRTLARNVVENQPAIDNIIAKAAPDWPIDQIAAIDRNVLRIGLYELLYADRKEVPAKVAINEAIELAKTFGGESSGKFVNGVLGTVYREIGEPGKEEESKRKKKDEQVNLEELPIERLGGAVVFAKLGGEVFVALVHDVFGYWTLAKGKLEGEEKEADATKREVMEEIGIPVVIEDELGRNEYIASHPEKGKIRKQVAYFLARAENGKQELNLKETGGLDDARWFSLSDLAELQMYDDIYPIITKALKILSQK